MPVVKSQEEIRTQAQWLKDYLLGKKSTIVFTGLPGVGKNVLFDYLMGTGYTSGYKPPGKSRLAEHGTKAEDAQKIALSTIPGGASGPRYDADQAPRPTAIAAKHTITDNAAPYLFL